MRRLLPFFVLPFLLVACDTAGDDEVQFATVTVEGGETYAFTEPRAASLDPVPGSPTVVLSFVLTDQRASGRQIRLDLSAEADTFEADSTYILTPHLDVGLTGDGESGIYARFFDCPVDQAGPCAQEYFATRDPGSPPFLQLLTLTDTEVTGAFGFQGLTTTSTPDAFIRGTFALPLGE